MSVSSIHPGPTVVFVDDIQWESFFHLAAILRKKGVRTVRVSVGLKGWQGNGLLFDRHVSLLDPPTAEQLSIILSNECVTDIQPTENLAMVAYAALDLLPASQRSDVWLGRRALLDKWQIATDLRDMGFNTPDTLLVENLSAAKAVESLSFPIVVKRRLSSGGLGVEIFECLEALEDFVRKIEDPCEWIFQRFVEGRPLVFASCVGGDGLGLVASYEILHRSYPRGPSTVVRVTRDDSLTKIGRLLINRSHVRGMICFDVIRDADGINWIHDVNPRVFAGATMCQSVGIDFYGFYARELLGIRSDESSDSDPIDANAYLFPSGWKEAFKSSRDSATGTSGFQWAQRHAKLLGVRYFLNVIARAIWRVSKRAIRFWRDSITRKAKTE